MSDLTRIWVTKHALTKGIQEVMARTIDATAYTEKYGQYVFYSGEGRDWHRTLANAISRAEDLRDAEIRRLEKKLIKINKLKFNIERIDL